jgi:MoCo/4Fe-4S cofactor protein with predicted Tat translocation signal
MSAHEPRGPLELATVRARLSAAHAGGEGGRGFWRSLEELAESEQFKDFLFREFPRHASEWVGGDVSRRRFLQVAGASLALGGLTACVRQPSEKIVPYVNQPEEVVLGNPLFFASALTLGGYATGVLVESHTGRPTKVEGNPEHPASLGGSDLFAQAEILQLYDPDRLQAVASLGRPRPWSAFAGELAGVRQAHQALRGAGLRILTGAVTSPTLADQLQRLLAELPEARWHVWEPAGRFAARAGAERAFGAQVEVRYDLAQADVVVALDSDFLTQGPGAVRYARDFTARRRVAWQPADGGAAREVLRLYAVESIPTGTGSQADHRLALAPADVARFALALAGELGVPGAAGAPPFTEPKPVAWVQEVARDLRRASGAGLVVAGDWAPPEVHVLAHAINAALGSAGRTAATTDPVVAGPPAATVDDPVASLRELTVAMNAGSVDTLLILGGNPVFTAPADLGFADALLKVERRYYHGAFDDETAEYCHWLIPEAHALEAWSDARAFDGTAAIVQPLILPLYPGSKSAHELVAALAGQPDAEGYDLVRDHWRRQGLGGAGTGEGDFEAAWMKAVHDGVVPDTALPTRTPSLAGGGVAWAAGEIVRRAQNRPELELSFRPDPTVWDGRYANNAWLQECPKPLTKLTWDNALLVSPATAERLGTDSTELVELRVGERTLELPVWILPGHADGAATLHLGYGRRRVGKVGSGTGFDAYALRTSDGLWTAPAKVERRAGSYRLACTQDHHAMEGRAPLRVGTLERFHAEPDFAPREESVPAPDDSMFPNYAYPGNAWGMSLDLSACTGCNACVVACQAENNIAPVGKTQVLNAREMHWIRIDRYFEGSIDDPAVHHQPMLCQQCERAPCELVCPVAATVHSAEGLNDMIYNRCVGTRYCSNNCPYKVRRFNFLKWSDTESELLKMARNPEVTVRGRGVMEKCSYCIQRIAHARAASKREARPIRDGEIVTACQQACPADAIRFGDVNDASSQVATWKAQAHDYTVLSELNTRPRTSYLAKLRNPNPALEGI